MAVEVLDPWDGVGLPMELAHRMSGPVNIHWSSKTFAVGTHYIPICGSGAAKIMAHIEKVSGGSVTAVLRRYVGANAGSSSADGWLNDQTLTNDTYYQLDENKTDDTAVTSLQPLYVGRAFSLSLAVTGSPIVLNVNIDVEPRN